MKRGKVLPVLRIFCSLCHCYGSLFNNFQNVDNKTPTADEVATGPCQASESSSFFISCSSSSGLLRSIANLGLLAGTDFNDLENI